MVCGNRSCRQENDWQGYSYVEKILNVLTDLWHIKWSVHVLFNCNSPAPKPADNISYGTRRCVRHRWGGVGSTQIRITKGSENDHIDAIILNSKIHSHFVNSYFTQVKTVKICLLMNISSCEFLSKKQLKQS